MNAGFASTVSTSFDQSQFVRIGKLHGREHMINFRWSARRSFRPICADILVYEFMENGSLDDHLYPPRGKAHVTHTGSQPRFLDWPTRMKIALGAAKGLAFLHEVEPLVLDF